MRYWWVNQNQTFREEIGGGYMWSPKRIANNARNRFYDNMRVVSPGDIVFSFVDTRIYAVGIILSYAYDSPKPMEFSVGNYWSTSGWKVDVSFHEMYKKVRPKEFINLLRPCLPQRYSPLTQDGNGLQNCYLAEIGNDFASVLVMHIGDEARTLVGKESLLIKENHEPFKLNRIVDEWESVLEKDINISSSISETEKKAIIMARRGQGLFRKNLLEIEKECRITHINNPDYLIASHVKPWRRSKNEERLNGENGLLLCPNIDRLFDNGLISFEDNGKVLISPVADSDVLVKMDVEVKRPMNVGAFSEGQRKFLDFHRNEIFLEVAG